MKYTLRQLEVFVAVAREASVSRAARALHMSQSAASGALGELETQFDVQLFDRIGKRLQLSELGRELRPQAEAALDRARDLERALENRGAVGPLRVGATLTIGNHLAVPLMARFLRENPGAQVTLEVANTREIARRAANFEIDVGLIEGEITHPELAILPWRDDELVVFCAPDHALAKRKTLSDDDLRAAAWIVREPGSGTRQTFDRAMHEIIHELDIALELQHAEAIIGAVKAGLGVGCLSRITLEDVLAHGIVRACRVPQRDLRRRFFFVLHRQKHESTAIGRWLKLCRESG